MKVGLLHGAPATAHRIDRAAGGVGCLIPIIGIVLQLHRLGFQIWGHSVALVPEEQHFAPVSHQYHRIMIDPHHRFLS
jgi:hypothetical protein